MNIKDKEKITKIITAAAAAPSGDNSQPWRFIVRGKSIEFYAIPERDNPILNYEESGTLIALGAAIQNAELEARAQGYAPRITFQEDGSCVAVMELEEGGGLDKFSSPLHEALFKRHTNRKAYKKIPLPFEVKSVILDPRISKGDVIEFLLIESQESMKVMSRALTTMEETALGNKNLHKLFFSDILWSAEENRAGKHGLYIKTLELPLPAQAIFRVLRYWYFAKFLARIGFPKMVAKTNAKQNASASGFGVIVAQQPSRIVYLEMGRMLERLWLCATAQGASVQIVTGITFLARSLRIPTNAQFFSPAEKERIVAAHMELKKGVDKDYEPILVFRIGMSDVPTEVSRRRTPEIVFA